MRGDWAGCCRQAAKEHIDGLAQASKPSLVYLAGRLGVSVSGRRPDIARRIIQAVATEVAAVPEVRGSSAVCASGAGSSTDEPQDGQVQKGKDRLGKAWHL